MKTIYLDNAATTFPKPVEVTQAVYECIQEYAVNPYRGNNHLVRRANSAINACRESLSKEFGVPADHVSIVPSATYGLNFILKGYQLRPGANVYSSGFEHNAVARCLHDLVKFRAIRWNQLPISSGMELDESRLIREFQIHPPDMVVLTHASNVTGDLLPVSRVAYLTHQFGGVVLLDAAQTAGVHTPSSNDVDFDFAAFSSHKGLYGIPGAGGLIIRRHVDKITPLISGGTGTYSEHLSMPDVLPNKFEPGTLNLPATVSMLAGLEWLLKTGKEVVREKVRTLTEKLVCGLRSIPSVRVYGHADGVQNVGIVSFRLDTHSVQEISSYLDTNGVCVRPGLHCAPLAHQTLKTYPHGTVRVSIGYFNCDEDIERLLELVEEMTKY